jgi:hypothetical protein
MNPEPRLDLMPSAADRWMPCAASPRFCLENADKIPADSSSRFSKEGNTAHEVAAAFLQDREPDPANYPTPIDEDMRWHAWNYMEYVNALRNTDQPGMVKLFVEQKMPLYYYEGRNAVVDAAVLNPDSLHIVDYKYGEGIIVNPVENRQMTIYARQIAGPLNLPLDFPVTLHIYQPRSRNAGGTPYHSWATTWGEIKRISDEIADHADVILINNRVKGGQLPFVASEKTCQWCPAKGFCPERQKQLLEGIEALEVIDDKPKSLPLANTISTEQIAAVLKHKSQIEKWLKDVEAYAVEQMKDGKAIPGYKLVLSRGGNRYWSDPEQAVKLLLESTILKRSEIVEEKIIGPAAVEKLLGKRKFSADVINLIAKPAGNPVIATEDDEREAYLLRAEDEFETLTDQP